MLAATLPQICRRITALLMHCIRGDGHMYMSTLLLWKGS